MKHFYKKAKRSQKRNWDELNKAQTEADPGEFRSLVGRILPSLQQYIIRRLNMAHATGALSKRELSAKKILDIVLYRII